MLRCPGMDGADAAFHQKVAAAAEHDEVLDIVTLDQHEAACVVDLYMVDDGQPVAGDQAVASVAPRPAPEPDDEARQHDQPDKGEDRHGERSEIGQYIHHAPHLLQGRRPAQASHRPITCALCVA
jgi:hypothetical protein